MPSAQHRHASAAKRRWFFSCVIHHVSCSDTSNFAILELLGVEGVNDVDAGQVFARDAVDLIGQLLDEAEARDADRS